MDDKIQWSEIVQKDLEIGVDPRIEIWKEERVDVLLVRKKDTRLETVKKVEDRDHVQTQDRIEEGQEVEETQETEGQTQEMEGDQGEETLETEKIQKIKLTTGIEKTLEKEDDLQEEIIEEDRMIAILDLLHIVKKAEVEEKKDLLDLSVTTAENLVVTEKVLTEE